MTGDASDYTAAEEGEIESALDRGLSDATDDEDGDGGGTTTINVRARIEWAGEVARANGGVRNTKLDGLDFGPVKQAHAAAHAAREAAEIAQAAVWAARPAASYTATGWHAQIRALTGSAHGSAAADRAGLAVTERTLMSWLAEERAPSRANQERIAAAYDALRTRRVDDAQAAHADAQQAYRAAQSATAEALSQALRNRYGSEIRITNIERFDIS